MAAGDKVQLKFHSLEIAKKRLMDAIRAIHIRMAALNAEYTADAVKFRTLRDVIEAVDNNLGIIQQYDNRPGISSSLTADYQTAYPAETTYSFADAATEWRAAAQAIYQWINTNNPAITLQNQQLTQAQLVGLGSLLSVYMTTVNEAAHAW